MGTFQKILNLSACAALAVLAYFFIRFCLWVISGLLAPNDIYCDFFCDLWTAPHNLEACLNCAIITDRVTEIFLITLFSLFIAGTISAVIRCVWQTVRGDNNKEEKTTTVSITSSGPLLFYPTTEFSGSPVVTLNSDGNPTGGTYQWSILSGMEKIHLEGDFNKALLEVKPVAPSDSLEDVVIKVVYTTEKGCASEQIASTIYTPRSAAQISTNISVFNGPNNYGYDFTVRYRILDQFGERFPEGYLSLTEKLSVILNPYNTQFEEREYISDENAEYDDHYTLIFNNQPVPNDYIAKVRQVVKAQGAVILDHILVWRSSQVDFE